MMGVARAHATADSNTRAIKQRIKHARLHCIHSTHKLIAILPCVGWTHSMDRMDSFYVSDRFMPWVARAHSLCRIDPLRVFGCIHSMDWVRAFHWLVAFIPLIDCMHSMCWVHSIPLVWLLPFHVLGASILCVGFIHPMHWMHSSICCMHSFHW